MKQEEYSYSREKDRPYIRSINNDQLEGLFESTLYAFARTGQIEREILSYASQAIKFASTLFPNEEIAFQIALDAGLCVKRLVNVKAHYRKHYKTEKKSKVLLNSIQMFQRMILCESQKWEKYQETEYLLQYLLTASLQTRNKYQAIHNMDIKSLEQELALAELEQNPRLFKLLDLLKRLSFDEQDLTVRYLAYLIQDSLNNNSSHAAFVVSHKIYDYPLTRVADICAFLNPESVGGHYLYDLRVKVMKKIKERFRPFINFKDEGVNEYLEIQEDASGELSQLIKTWLYNLIPWQTKCPNNNSDAKVRLFEEDLFNWLAKIKNIDEKEISRTHVVICPECYEKVIAECLFSRRSKDEAKQMPLPRPAIPQFTIPKGEGDHDMQKKGTDRQKQRLDKEALKLKESLDKESSLVAFTSRNLAELIVFADGKKVGDLNLAQDSSLQLDLDENVTLIKVMSRDKDSLLLLASLLLCREEITESWSYRLFGWKRYTAKLEEGGSLLFTLSFCEDESHTGFTVNIGYSRPILKKIPFGLYIDRTLELFAPGIKQSNIVAGLIMALVLVLISVLGLLYIKPFKNRVDSTDRANSKQTPLITPSPIKKDSSNTEENRSQHIAKDEHAAQEILSLKDGSRMVTLDSNGHLVGLEALSANQQQVIKDTLTIGEVKITGLDRELVGHQQRLMGSGDNLPFALLSPVGKVVPDVQPTLRWRALAGATSYVVSIYDKDFNRVAMSESLAATEWRISSPLPRGKIYSWQVKAIKDGQEILLTTPDAPDAKFKVLEQSKAITLQQVKRSYRDSHLALGIFYAQAGLLDDARSQLQALLKANPQSQIAQKLLHSIATIDKNR